jgi:class IIb bacteriocin, lactobin A/cerein 7B family|nr:class IIb bacteriocin, lactobin A/cerein 7B family [uncultured Neisseria sp.]
MNSMIELKMDELEVVSGGIAPLVAAGIFAGGVAVLGGSAAAGYYFARNFG